MKCICNYFYFIVLNISELVIIAGEDNENWRKNPGMV